MPMGRFELLMWQIRVQRGYSFPVRTDGTVIFGQKCFGLTTGHWRFDVSIFLLLHF